MSSFTQVLIGGYPSGGLMTDQKPLMLPDEAFSTLQNAYVFRKRTKKRQGTVGMGRLRRFFSGISVGFSGANPQTFNLYTVAVITPEPNAEIAEGSVVVVIGPSSYQDQGNGTLLPTAGVGNGTINYLTGAVSINTGEGPGNAITVSFGYYPSLPVMGIWKRDVSSIGVDQTIFFDTVYAYQYILGGFEQIAGATWSGPINANGTNTYFFWACNYQGATPDSRYFFVTNNNITATTFDPIRYLSPTNTWTALTPLVTASITLYQALIVIPYYGRLLALNTWEGTTDDTFAAATNFYARCRFSQIGNPIGADSWRSDIFGLGGFLDAPTNESIVSATFYRNTLIVFFEYSTWQLRYIGEYGLPFIFERISSDFGATSTFSPVIFDSGVLAIGGRGIIKAQAGAVGRIDEQIPDTSFGFQIQNNSPDFVHGVRDFEKELVFWNYFDDTDEDATQVWPNTTLVYNYQNNTWAQFRDTITCFGTGQFQFGVTWDSLTALWENFDIKWDSVDDQQYVDYTIAGNQQGFIFIYENQNASVPNAFVSQTMFAPSLAITGFDFTQHPTQIIVPQHNLVNEEIIYLQGTIWSGVTPALNNQIYQVKVISVDRITLGLWDQPNLNYVDYDITSSTYIGGGLISLLPRMNIQGKDFNPFQSKGLQFKLSSIDFQMDSNQASPAIPAVSIQLFVNSYLGEQANMIFGNQELLNDSQNVGFITGIQLTNPCIVMSPDHSLATGQLIYIANIIGTTQLNNALYTVTVIDANNFSLNGIDATAFTPYISGGIWNTDPVDGQTYIPGSQYAWYSFYSNQFGQYMRVGITYDDTLMNQLSTHQLPMELNAMMLYFRPGGAMTN
jgi:hypothetical protein